MNPLLGGGAVTTALNLCRGLVKEGVEVVALSTHDQAEPRVEHREGIKFIEFRPNNLYWVARKDRQPALKKAVWQLIDIWNPHVYRYVSSIIQSEKPDVIHVNKLRGLSPSVWAAAAKNNVPIIQSCHDYELISPEGSLESTIGQMALNQHWTMRPYQAIRSRFSNEVDVVTAPSEFTLETITGLGFFGNAHKYVVPNSHGFTKYELEKLHVNHAEDSNEVTFNFLYLGRLETIKGIDILCQAFSELAKVLPFIRLDIAGSGARESALRAEFAQMPQIRFHGHVSGETKNRLITSANMLVMPSIVREVFGISIVEAYAYGKPVIASRIGGIPELVREGHTGILVEPNDVDDLRKGLSRMANAPNLARAMSSAAREAASAFTLEAITESFTGIYKTIQR